MVISNVTKFSPEQAYGLLYTSGVKNNLKNFIFPLILFFMGLIIIVLSLVNNNLYHYLELGWIFFAVAIGFIIYNLYLLSRLEKNIKKKNPEIIENGIVYEFTFKEESFSVISKSGKLVNKYSSSYKDIKKIIKKEDYIIFVIDNDNRVIARNEGFKNAKELELFFFGLNKHKIKIK